MKNDMLYAAILFAAGVYLGASSNYARKHHISLPEAAVQREVVENAAILISIAGAGAAGLEGILGYRSRSARNKDERE